jgi:hypothetical protein
VSVVDAIAPEPPETAQPPEVGMKVAVRNRYLGTWSAGFEVVALHLEGYSIRRTSDGAVLPEVIRFSDVREPWSPAADWVG